MKVRGWWSREALLASPVCPERFLCSVSAVTQGGFQRDHHVGGHPARSVRGGPDRFHPERPGQLTRPSSHSALRRPDQGGGEWPCSRSPLAGPCSRALCFSRGPELFKPLGLSLSLRPRLSLPGHGCALCLPESLS